MSINREATIRWKGYDPADLKPKSHKKIWANCDECGYGRWIAKGDYTDLCHKCACNTEEHKTKISKANKGRKHSQESITKMSENQMGKNNSFYGKRHSPETIAKMSEDRTGDNHPKGMLGKKHSPTTRKKLSLSRKRNCSEDEPNYIHGKFALHDEWKRLVLERDNYTCVICKNPNKRPNTHHIFPRREYPNGEDLFGIWNGITLCNSCHRKAHGRDKEYHQDWFVDINMSRMEI